MKGFVPTPSGIVDLMVRKLFRHQNPERDDVVLDPGCGTGAFIQGIIDYCDIKGIAIPRIVGVESDPKHALVARSNFAGHPEVDVRQCDFLRLSDESYDFIIGNPPYVPITQLSEGEKAYYRAHYRTAVQRFDLYILFLEQAMGQLKPSGRLVFITPEKYLYVDTAEPLRRMMAAMTIEEIHFAREASFGKLVTYPTITTLVNSPKDGATNFVFRDGKVRKIGLPKSGRSWQPTIMGQGVSRHKQRLEKICDRISCGVATGADSIFVLESADVPARLLHFAHPTLSGRDIDTNTGTFHSHSSMLIPYSLDGSLMDEKDLGPLRTYLRQDANKARLLKRTCVDRKPWYAFHENPPMEDIMRPKLLCKDIAPRAVFVADWSGEIIPRHSVYYIVPRNPLIIRELADYLNSADAQEWLRNNCQRAANGFIRLQSQVLKRLPVPDHLAPDCHPGGRKPMEKSQLDTDWRIPMEAKTPEAP